MKHFPPYLVVFSILICSGGVLGQSGSMLHKWTGAAAGDNFGFSVSGAGDVNGDGFPDLIVGARNTDPGGLIDAGSAYVYSGLDGALIYQWDGGAAGDQFGRSVSAAGDVNNDGVADVIVGADGANPDGRIKAGSAYVYSGADGSLLWQGNGGKTNDRFGTSVSAAGDVNADGFDDLIVGSPGRTVSGHVESGRAFVISGADGDRIYSLSLNTSSSALAHFGESVSGAGDVNNDGFPDLIVGAHWADPGGLSDAGSAYVYSGVDGSILYQWDGGSSGDSFGKSVSGAGDVNGDGFADLIVGAFNASPGGITRAGSAHVYSGADGSQLFKWDGESEKDEFAYSVSGAGDVNGDGFADLIVGAFNANPGSLTRAGSAYVYSGANGSLLLQWDGDRQDDQLGFSVAGAGDVDGDGFDDLIFGARYTDPGGRTDAGSAYVCSGDSSGPTLTITNLVSGQVAVVDVTNCTPDKNVYLAWSFAGGGPTTTPFGPGYVSSPFKYTKMRMDAFGNASMSKDVPPGLSGKDIWFHGADINSEVMLNPLALTIQ